jgi:uncharacterized protein YecT (DUF1311 family)
MNRIRTTALAFFLLAHCAAVGATESASARVRRDAPKGITEAFYACIDKADSNMEEAFCLSQERGRQDHRLNATYQALLGKLSANQKQNLVEAERAWLKFQDTTARFQGELYGNDLVDNLQIAQNEAFAICKRADELGEYLTVASGL